MNAAHEFLGEGGARIHRKTSATMTSTLFAAVHGVSAMPLSLPTIAWPKLETMTDLILDGMLSAHGGQGFPSHTKRQRGRT